MSEEMWRRGGVISNSEHRTWGETITPPADHSFASTLPLQGRVVGANRSPSPGPKQRIAVA